MVRFPATARLGVAACQTLASGRAGPYLRLLALLAAALLASRAAHAGAWTQDPGRGYYKVEGRARIADELYTPAGGRIAIPELGDYSLALYGEHGIAPWLTVHGYAPAKRLALNEVESAQTGQTLSEGDAESGAGDWDVGFRFALVRGRPTVLSTGITFGIPLGNDEQESGLLTGDGEFNQLVTLQVGRSLRRAPIYASALVGYNLRHRGYSDEWHYGGEIGFRLGRRLSVELRARGVESTENGDGDFGGGASGLYSNNQEYLLYGPEVSWRFNEHFGLSAAFEDVSRGRNVLAAPAYSLAIFVTR
jgi:hypothetical protein